MSQSKRKVCMLSSNFFDSMFFLSREKKRSSVSLNECGFDLAVSPIGSCSSCQEKKVAVM